MAHRSESTRDQSPVGERPNMSDLRIVLLGKNASENNKVGNVILDKYVFGKKSSPNVEEHSGKVEGRNITVISTIHLLKSNLTLPQIAQKVSEVSPREPDVIILVLQHDDFSERKRDRLPSVLNYFGEQAMNRTMIVTTDDKTHTAKHKSENEYIQQITKECGGGRLQFQNTQHSQILQKVDEIIIREFKKTKQESSLEQEDMRSDDRRPKEMLDVSNTVSSSENKTLIPVLCGYDEELKTSMLNLLLGKNTPISTQQESRSLCVRRDVELHARQISLVELPALSRLSEEEVMRQTLRCVSLCDPGIHAFLFIVPAAPLTDEAKSEIEKVQKVFDSKEHLIVLFSSYSTKERAKDFFQHSPESQQLISLCGGQYRVIGLNEPENSRQIPDLLDYIENMKTEPYSAQMYVKALENRVRRDTEEKYKEELKRTETEINELQQTTQSEGYDLRIVLMGKNVSENSRVGNLILGTDVFDREASLVKRKLQPRTQRFGGRLKDRHVTIINSPQLLQTNISDHQITQTVRECVSLSDPGPHAFILVLQYKDFTEEDMTRVKHVLKKFSEEANKWTIVLTTDQESYGSKISSFFVYHLVHQLIKDCGGRNLQFDEKKPEWRSEIFKSVDKILKENQEDYLTCEIFHDVIGSPVDEELNREEDSIRPEEENEEHSNQEDDGKPKERQKERSDKVSENVPGKQKLNLVLCGSDGSLAVSVSKLIQGKKLKFSHQKVISKECVRRDVELHGRQISLVELPALSRLSADEVRHQTLRCVSFCDPGVHVFLLILPAGPLNNEDKAEMEEIQKIFDSREHFMLLFTSDLPVEDPVTEFVRSSKDSQRLISLCGGQFRVIGLNEPESSRQIPDLLDYIENMKTEPYSLQIYMKAQENRVRRETEEKYKEELKRTENKIKELQEKIQSVGAKDEADDLCLRIVLIGRTGNGKSATGNTILGQKEFDSKSSTDSVTTVCEKRVGEVDGQSVAVVDTPGLFDTSLTNDQVVEEIMKCISLSSPGPHVFIIVLSVGRFIQVESDTLDLIKKIFGPKSAQFSIVLFTRGDDLEDESIEDYVKRSNSAELKKLIRDCGNRFLVFNNREKRDRTQVTQLLNMIEELKNINEGRYFTNSMFEEAEMSIKKRMEEILKEREREIQTQKEELQAKYEMEMKIMMKRLKEEKQRAEEERKKMENQIRAKEEKLRKEFEEKEKTEQKKREIENQKRSEEEKQQRAEYHQKIEEMKREIENQRSQYEKQQKEREEEDRKREDKYRQDQEKMKNEQERIIAELQMKQEEEIKKRELEEKRRKKEEEEERKRWERKIKEAENDRKEIQEEIKGKQREWEDEKKRQMREREEEERKRKERHEEQMREKQEELEKMRKKFEREKEEERQKIEDERQKQKREREEKEREYEEKKNNMERHYERLERERKEEWERRKREDEERREEERKKWERKIEDLKQKQEEEKKKRENEEKERKEKEEKERDEMKQKHEEEIKDMKKKHEDEARKQAEELNDFKERKEQHIQELKEMLEERQKQHELLEKLYKHLQVQKGEEIKKLEDQKEKEITKLKNQEEEIKRQQDQKEKERKEQQDQKEKERKEQQDQKEKERKELLEEIERLKKRKCVIL